MEQLVRVKEIQADGRARVFCIRESDCSGDCHKCSGCGAAKETVEFTADNPIGAAIGDLVRVESESGTVLKAAAVLYVLPLVLFFLGYGLAGGWGGGGGFLLGVAAVVLYDRRCMSRREIRYKITAFAQRAANEEAIGSW